MSEEKHNQVVVLLANDALEASEEKGALASLLLIDAALTIAVTRLGVQGAKEMAGMLVEYIGQQMRAFEASIGGDA